MTSKAETIRAFNDNLRRDFSGGSVVITVGVAALGQEAVERIAKAISCFNEFCFENDPHEEHDFGALVIEREKVFFKIDYYDQSLQYHSPDPSDPSVTRRVMTIMLAEEY